MSIFDAIKVADDLESAVRDTLSAWFPTYVREFELQHNVPADALPLPKQYVVVNDLDDSSGDQLPAIVIVSPGMSPRMRPLQEGDGTFRLFFGVGIGVFVSSNNRRDTARLVRQYVAIVRTIILQHQSLDGFADGCEWVDESYDGGLAFPDEETLGAGQVVFEFEVAGVVSRFGGPAYQIPPDPVNQPGSVWPEVETVIATVEVEET